MGKVTQKAKKNKEGYNGIVEALDKIVRGKGQNQDRVFRDFVALSEYTLRRIPDHIKQIGVDGKLSEDDDEGKRLWAELTERHGKEAFEHFHAAFHLLVDYASDWLERQGDDVDFVRTVVVGQEEKAMLSGPDLLGMLHMNYGYSNDRAGQYFTPWNICLLMAKMIRPENALWAHIKEGCRKASEDNEVIGIFIQSFYLLSQAFEGKEGFDKFGSDFLIGKLLPLIRPYVEPVSLNEPCCGSGTLVLAMMLQFPQWARAAGLVQMFAMDIDPFCVLMTKTNCLLYGVNGEHVRHILQLTQIERERYPERYQEVIALAAEKGAEDPQVVEAVQVLATEKYQQMSMF